MDIANPILNLKNKEKKNINISTYLRIWIPEDMDMVDWSRSLLHIYLVDGNEKCGFPLVCLMKNG
jgi:hypothetical protein